MTEKRTIYILGSQKQELARIHVPQGEDPIEVEVVDRIVWEVFELDVVEKLPVVNLEETPPVEEETPAAAPPVATEEEIPAAPKPPRGKRKKGC